MNISTSSLLPGIAAISLFLGGIDISNAALVTDDFSGSYPGGGLGWTEDWNYRHYRTTDPDSKAQYRSGSPLPGNDYYLSVRYNHNISGSGPYSIISRPFDTAIINNLAAHTVSFDFRLDSATHWNNAAERFVVFAASQAVTKNAAYENTATNTWGISYDGANGWTMVEGDGAGGVRYVAPSVQFQSAADGSTVYNITLNIDPASQTFTVSISDGDRTENWSNQAFNFINPTATASGEYLHFYVNTRTGVNMEYSVAGLRVEQIPEPGAVALAGVPLLGLGLRRWLRRRRSE